MIHKTKTTHGTHYLLDEATEDQVFVSHAEYRLTMWQLFMFLVWLALESIMWFIGLFIGGRDE